MSNFLWGTFPYVCATLFFVVPFVRMIYRPFGWSTRATSMYNRKYLGIASLLLHWGIFLELISNLVALFGGLAGSEA